VGSDLELQSISRRERKQQKVEYQEVKEEGLKTRKGGFRV
jgi:hypothetical protein